MDFLINTIFAFRFWIVTDLFRYLFMFLDGIIYNLVQPLYSASIELSDIRAAIQQDAIVEMIISKIYIFLGVFMVFKLAFSIISMIANPDYVEDKQKGLAKVFTHSLITLVLVVVMPSIFRMAYNLQNLIIKEGYLSGVFSERVDGSVSTGNEGAELARSVFGVFVNETNQSDNSSTKAIEKFKSQTDGVNVGILNENGEMIAHTKQGYRLSYMMLISTIVGGMMVMAFLKIGIEVAVRSLKLFVLEIISPIAVISYIDPASSSKGIFAKWLSLVIKVYISLFIRLSILFLLTGLLSRFDITSFGGELGLLASILLILAILAFMQSAPKMLEELFGYKPSEDSKAISGIVGGALGFGVGAATGAIGVASQLGKWGMDKAMGDRPPGKFMRGLKKFGDAGGAVTGGFSDILKSGSEGMKKGAKDGPMSAMTTPKDLNYKQADQSREKARAERWEKQKEYDNARIQGKKLMKDFENYTNEYITNDSNYAGDATYAALKTAATAPGATTADKEAFKTYAKEAGKTKMAKNFNEQIFSETIASKKNFILDTEIEISSLTSTKISKQAELDSVISRGFAPGSIEYDTALSDLMSVNGEIAEKTETLEKTKGGLETLLKSPTYTKDAKTDVAFKMGKTLS